MQQWDKKLAGYIDHTLLKEKMTEEEVLKICDEANHYGFKGVCLYRQYMPLARKFLRGPLAIAVIDFPKGKGGVELKRREALEAVSFGAEEIDMVIDYGKLKEKKYDEVFLGIREVVAATLRLPVKVILECCVLSHDEKVIACALAQAAGARYVKTSTGFHQGGAMSDDVVLMRNVVGGAMGVKASGGIKTRDEAWMLIKAGADRLGTSRSLEIVTSDIF